MKDLFLLPINLQRVLIHTNEPERVNTVVAYYNRHNDELVIRALYGKRGDRSEEPSIVEFAENNIEEFDRETSTITLGDGFDIVCYNKDRK